MICNCEGISSIASEITGNVSYCKILTASRQRQQQNSFILSSLQKHPVRHGTRRNSFTYSNTLALLSLVRLRSVSSSVFFAHPFRYERETTIKVKTGKKKNLSWSEDDVCVLALALSGKLAFLKCAIANNIIQYVWTWSITWLTWFVCVQQNVFV